MTKLQLVGASQDFTFYDGVEVHPCAVWIDPQDGSENVVTLDGEPDDPAPAFWSVYLHCRTGGVECVCDCPTPEAAERMRSALDYLVAVAGAEFTCAACGRAELACSVAPCFDVIADREAVQ